MGRVAADQRDDNPGSEERGLGAPALLGEISAVRNRQQNVEQGRQQRGDPEHGRGDSNSPETWRTEMKTHGKDAERRNGYADMEYMAVWLSELKGKGWAVSTGKKKKNLNALSVSAILSNSN